MIAVGQPFPAFRLQDDQGGWVTEAALRGGWTIMYAYPKDSTPGCTTEACDFRDRRDRWLGHGAQVLGISKDSLASHRKFVENQGLTFRLLSDPGLDLLKALGAYGTKMMYGKETQGIIRSTFLVDPEGVLRHTWPKVSVKGHVDEVLETLERLRG